MQSINDFKRMSSLSLLIGFGTGILSMVYLFAHNPRGGTPFFSYVMFALSILLISTSIGAASCLMAHLFTKKSKFKP